MNAPAAPPTVYLISGQIGAGKTTFARRLAQETGAVRFSPDEWLLHLHGDVPLDDGFDPLFDRCCALAWSVARELVVRGHDVVLDFGFWTRADRDAYRRHAREAGGQAVLYHVDTPEPVIRARLHARNADPPAGTFVIPDAVFDRYAPGFEPPAPEEGAVVVRTDVG